MTGRFEGEDLKRAASSIGSERDDLRSAIVGDLCGEIEDTRNSIGRINETLGIMLGCLALPAYVIAGSLAVIAYHVAG